MSTDLHNDPPPTGPIVSAWPSSLALVRHGQSAGNVARDAAEAAKASFIDIEQRDMDVPLSPLGLDQARSLQTWFEDPTRRPDVVLTSPYVRAEQTAAAAVETLGVDPVLDERLREREFGSLDRLTYRGIEERFPDEAAARARVGKFYYRPPGGESWCDVGLRVRSMLDTISRQYAGRRVVIVAHEVVILMACYVLQHLREQQVLDLAKAHPLANCSVTTFEAAPDATEMTLVDFGDTRAVDAAPAPTTNEPDPAPAVE